MSALHAMVPADVWHRLVALCRQREVRRISKPAWRSRTVNGVARPVDSTMKSNRKHCLGV